MGQKYFTGFFGGAVGRWLLAVGLLDCWTEILHPLCSLRMTMVGKVWCATCHAEFDKPHLRAAPSPIAWAHNARLPYNERNVLIRCAEVAADAITLTPFRGYHAGSHLFAGASPLPVLWHPFGVTARRGTSRAENSVSFLAHSARLRYLCSKIQGLGKRDLRRGELNDSRTNSFTN